jgi:iron(II)-dependent oxidoreductase
MSTLLAAPAAADLIRLLTDARARTLRLFEDLTGERLLGPKLAIVNPPLWEIGHLGWFQERWCLRQRDDDALGASILDGADTLYDSAAVAHDTRWGLPLPSIADTRGYIDAVLQRVVRRIERGAAPQLSYFVQLAALHEQMHCEAFTYTRQTLGYPRPAQVPHATAASAGPLRGDVDVTGGTFLLGARRDDGFVFDNEKWAHEVTVAPFAIARAPVTNAEFAAFVDDGGYTRRELWRDDGWRWRESMQALAPVYWGRQNGGWLRRSYDAIVPLAADVPVIHVNWFEADAWCRWAGRRLPTEAEWEFTTATVPGNTAVKRRYPWGDAAPRPQQANLYGAGTDCIDVAAGADGDSAWGCRQMIGNVWEWTADWFNPYPGFVRDPYKEYSEPWFGNHRVLRGGCFATHPALIRNTWRNFYTPDRRDVFAGFRTCAR